MYGGSGASPAGSPSSRSRQRPSPSGSTSSTGPSRCPALSLRDGRARPSQSPFCPTRSSSSTSASPPPGRSSRSRAGRTRVSFTTVSVSGASSSGSSSKRRWRTAPAGALQDGLREQVRPVGRNRAEIRGLTNQVIRRLERVEGDLLAERHARVDDLALLVDLISSSWKSVDERLGSLEKSLQSGEGAIVYRIEERRAETG